MSMSCEEYVVQRLEKLDEEYELEKQAHRDDVEGLNKELRELALRAENQEKILNKVRSFLKVGAVGDNHKSISFRKSIWDNYDADEFQWFIDTFHLDVDADEEE